MAQYINKDDLVEEIEKRLDELWDLLPNASDVIKDNYTKEEANITGKYTALESFEKFINTLEVKEVDLVEEITKFFSKNPIPCEHITEWPLLKNTAIHFFELGLNTKKEK